MIKTIAIDMDGTLLNKMQTVSEENKSAIHKAQEEGIEVIIATGRSFEEARYALDKVGLECPIICVNGAALFTQEGKVAASHPMQIASVKNAAEWLEERGIYFEIYTSKGIFSKNYETAIDALVDVMVTANQDIDPSQIRKYAEARLQLGHVTSIADYTELFDQAELELYKILGFSTDLQVLDQAASRFKMDEGTAVTSSGRENVEITSKHAQKGIVLEKYVNEKEGSMQETMAIGDNYNDISMFERVGLSVAMGNAPTDIQNLCDEVTGTNEEHGVAKAILKVLKKTIE
ncbi:Cof-type HAD-IIB family hydrolase [Peribacillus sp. NPDC097264]|uniref:Cof-type HAD-IIB family hydrolase n=1 Tax=Peribacillus sp. NPDC097264 TaxID=3390616 RepID=UPI003CFD9D9A